MKSPTLEQRLAHRAPPQRAHVMTQSWEELLFLHWRFPRAEIEALLPEGLFLDTFEGEAWVGIVPFLMRKVRPRFLPAFPGLSDFCELNLRTYVFDAERRSGVWFFSLDANQSLAVRVARKFFSLPYEHAKMSAGLRPANPTLESGLGPEVSFRSLRRDDPTNREMHYVYQPIGTTRLATPGSLDFFLSERYLLFAHDQKRNRLRVGQVHHAPYKLSDVKVSTFDPHLFALNQLSIPEHSFDHAVYSQSVAVKIYRCKRLIQSRDDNGRLLHDAHYQPHDPGHSPCGLRDAQAGRRGELP